MINIKFILKDPSSTKDSLIYMCVWSLDKTFKYSTSKKANKNTWDTTNQRLKYKRGFGDAKQIELDNERLDELEVKLKKAYRDLIKKEKKITAEALKNELEIKLGKKKDLSPNKNPTFLEFVEKYCQEVQYIITKKSAKQYKSTHTRLLEFKEVYGHFDYDDINLNFYREFRTFLLSINLNKKESDEVRYMTKNSLGKHQKVLKRLLDEAYERGYTKNDFYKSKKFKVESEKVTAVYLTNDEIIKLHNYQFKKKYLEEAADRFLIGACTGLRYSDFIELSKFNIKDDYIEKNTRKTRVVVRIPTHKIIKDILKKYKGNLPSEITNQTLNRFIKEACKEAGINSDIELVRTEGNERVVKRLKKWQAVSTHTARRSFATNLYLEHIRTGKIGLKTIMSWTGHKSIDQLLDYVHADQMEMTGIVECEYFNIG